MSIEEQDNKQIHSGTESEIKDRVSKATQMIFSEREDFIIIGLTGRTGAGCTTVANQLQTEFNELSLPKPVKGQINNDKRKYKIVYDYANKNWKKFQVIKFRDIIVSFILEYEFTEFKDFLNSMDDIQNKDKLILNLEKRISREFALLHKSKVEMASEIEKKGNEDVLGEEATYEYYFHRLPNLSKDIQEILNSHSPNLYTNIFQVLANNVRKSGEAYKNEFDENNIFRLSQRTNKLIKILRRRNLRLKGRVLVVIDALRNPYEITFFKDRYSAFYMFSVNTDEETRVQRLISRGFTKEQIEVLDKKEYPDKMQGTDLFVSQNIKRCLQLSEIHLVNRPPKGCNNYTNLNEQLIRYISLIMHPGLVSPTHIERCMQIAYISKLNSGCLSRQVGAVVTDESFAIKSIGWNSVGEGQVPCNLRDICTLFNYQDEDAFSIYEYSDESFKAEIKSLFSMIKKNEDTLKGRKYPYCFKDIYNKIKGKENQVHTRSLHAEENAFLQIAKNGGIGLKGGYLFTTASPCELCSKKAYQLGIKKIFYIDPYPGISLKHILKSGLNQPNLELFNGAVGNAYTKLYTTIIPQKDELRLLLGK